HLNGATYSADRLYDAQRNSTSPVKIYTLIGEDQFCINGRPSFNIQDIVPLGFSKTNAGPETFTVSLADVEGIFGSGQSVYLHDSATNQYHNLADGPYSLTMEALSENSRYKLVYTSSP